DRIEIADGGANICDYKSGAVPTASEVLAGKKPQLPLEALILRKGGFGDIAKDVTRLDGLTYISTRIRETLGAELDIREIVPKEGTLDEFVKETHQGLKHLLGAYLDEEQPYLCQPRGESRSYAGDYDHLARLPEWSSAAPDGDG
ncbi:MAG: PD-(D/E)XK nuclease family protein, partial [Hyphomicrobiales bacterium]|nr:PD-(D/E)XK nuclease family protein [Hyphomicrobiales bacterium]